MTQRLIFLAALIPLLLSLQVSGQESEQSEVVISIEPDQPRQTFDGMGCGSIFYSGHLNSLAKRNKNDLQRQLYDDLFKEIPTKFLHVMIRPAFEPENDNDDPYDLNFAPEAFKKNADALEVYRESRKRQPEMEIYATLYTPPAWMKTNGQETAGGKVKATLKPGLELELGEYMWAYLQHMNKEGCPVKYLSICNEPDWTHTQPGYFLRPKEHAKLFRILVDYFERMARKDPATPMPQLVAPNGISVINAAKRFLPALDAKSQKAVSVLGSHDYDRAKPERWQLLRDAAGERPVWCTEWCWNGKDYSPDLIQAANASWSVMCDGFNHGVNVWMTYDWVYPPRPGGEALVHVDWGKSYHRTKMYYAFRQWSRPLTPGMRVVHSEVQAPLTNLVTATGGKQKAMESSVKSVAFIDPETQRMVIHIVNTTEQPTDFELRIKKYGDVSLQTVRTSGDSSDEEGEVIEMRQGKCRGRLQPREMLTLQTEAAVSDEPQPKN